MRPECKLRVAISQEQIRKTVVMPDNFRVKDVTPASALDFPSSAVWLRDADKEFSIPIEPQ